MLNGENREELKGLPRPAKRRVPVWAMVLAGFAVLAVIAVVLVGSRGGPSQSAKLTRADVGASTPRPERPELELQPHAGTGEHDASGMVVDAGGGPVAGAWVTAEIEIGPGVDSMPGLSMSPAIVALTDDQGVFTLRGMEPGRYRLRVEGQGIFTSEVRFVDVPNDGLRLVVARRVNLVGSVSQEGLPAADVEVSLTGYGVSGTRTARTGLAGGFVFRDLPEGTFRVRAATGERASHAARVDRFGAGPFVPVLLELGPAAIVRGRVVDTATGRGVAAAVRLTAHSLDEPPAFGRAGADGHFQIEGVLLGRWTAAAAAPGYVAVEAISFEVGSTYAPTVQLTPGGVVSGRVVTLDGVPVAGATMSMRGRDASDRARTYSAASQRERLDRFTGYDTGPVVVGLRFVPRGELGVLLGPIPFPPPKGSTATRVTSIVRDPDADEPVPDALPVAPELESMFVTDDRGRFRVTGVSPGRYRVGALHPDYADGLGEAFSLALGTRVDDLVVTLAPGVVFFGTVKDDAGQVIVGATIIADVVDDEASRVQAVTGVDGMYRLGPIAHDVTLRATAVRHGDVERAIKLGKLEPIRSQREESFTLLRADRPVFGRLRDQSGFPVRGAVVSVRSRDRKLTLLTGTSDDAGRFMIAGLAPGNYALIVEHGDFPPVEAKAKTDVSVDIVVAFGGGIDGMVRDAHTRGALRGAHVTAVGPNKASVDLVVGEDGGIELVPLAPGTWQFEVTFPGYVKHKRAIVVPIGDKPRAITVRDVMIELERGATLGGIVRDVNGDRVRGAKVTVGNASTTTDENGRFRMVDVPTGDVEIVLERNSATGRHRLSLAPGDEVVTLELKID